jgi:hypothetical protein
MSHDFYTVAFAATFSLQVQYLPYLTLAPIFLPLTVHFLHAFTSLLEGDRMLEC